MCSCRKLFNGCACVLFQPKQGGGWEGGGGYGLTDRQRLVCLMSVMGQQHHKDLAIDYALR